jgi:hypothetical protein
MSNGFDTANGSACSATKVPETCFGTTGYLVINSRQIFPSCDWIYARALPLNKNSEGESWYDCASLCAHNFQCSFFVFVDQDGFARCAIYGRAPQTDSSSGLRAGPGVDSGIVSPFIMHAPQ